MRFGLDAFPAPLRLATQAEDPPIHPRRHRPVRFVAWNWRHSSSLENTYDLRPGRFTALIIAVLATAGLARAQEEAPTVVPIVLRPAMAPVPALKYRLLPERHTLIPGNAAIFYHRAVEIVVDPRRSAPPRGGKDQADFPDGQTISDWISGPSSGIPLERAHQWLDRNSRALHEVELGTRRQFCDWEFDSRSEGLELNLGEIQEMRALARMIAVRIRVAILENKLDEAVHWLQIGLTMARHVSQGPTLIQSLVGLAFCGQLTKPVEDLIQAPGMPSLYWALANRPRPFIDLDPALEGERFILEREFPRAPRARWRRLEPGEIAVVRRGAGNQVLQTGGLGTARPERLASQGRIGGPGGPGLPGGETGPDRARAARRRGGSHADLAGGRVVYLSVLSGPSR